MLYAAGRDLNLLERARAITLSPAADALFPPARLYDGYGDAITRFGAATSPASATVDLAMLDSSGLDNGNLDTWPLAGTGWTVTKTGTGDVVQTSVGAEVRSGSAAKLNKGSGSAKITKTYRVRAGERLTVDLWLRIAGSGQAKTQIFNPVTRKYLTSGGAWQAAQAYWSTETVSTTYVNKTLAFQVEDFKAHQGGTTYLELMIEDTGAGGGSDFAFVDDVFLYPTWNALVVVGHNIDPGVTTEVRSSTDNFGASNVLEATIAPPTRPAFYGYLAMPAAKRYVRLLLTGAQSSQSGAAYMAELAVCYLESALVPEKWEWEVQFLEDQIRNTTRSGHVSVAPQAEDTRRVLRLSFRRRNDAGYREGRDDIIRQCRGGQWPVIVVPIDTEDLVVHGRLDSSWRVLRQFLSAWEDDITLSETPLPQVTS